MGSFDLSQIYPNPINPSKAICYSLPYESHFTSIVYNTLGQQVATLVQGEKAAGYHEVTFEGSGVPSDVYLYRWMARQTDGGQVDLPRRRRNSCS